MRPALNDLVIIRAGGRSATDGLNDEGDDVGEDKEPDEVSGTETGEGGFETGDDEGEETVAGGKGTGKESSTLHIR